MPVQYDSEPSLPGVRNQAIENFHRSQILEIRIPLEIDAVRLFSRIEHLITKRDSDRVKPEAFDLIEHIPVAPKPEAVRGECRTLHAKPVHAGDPDRPVVRIEDPVSLGVPIVRCRCLTRELDSAGQTGCDRQ